MVVLIIWKTPFQNIQGTVKTCLKYITWTSTPQGGMQSDHNKEEMLIKWELICLENRCWTYEKRLVTINCAQPLFPRPSQLLSFFLSFFQFSNSKWVSEGITQEGWQSPVSWHVNLFLAMMKNKGFYRLRTSGKNEVI